MRQTLAKFSAMLIVTVAIGPFQISYADDSVSASPYVSPQTQVKLPDGRKFNFVCQGSGSPVVILEAGLGDWSYHMRDILPQLATVSRVCIPDRAGYGFSDPGPKPRDAKAEVADLEQALIAAKLPPPYVIAGGSLGGLYARLFAYRNPEKLAGVLLIDPTNDLRVFGTPEQYAQRMNLAFQEYCAKQATEGKLVAGQVRPGDEEACVPDFQKRWDPSIAAALTKIYSAPSHFETVLAEFQSGYDVDTAEVTAARRPLGNIPLVILSQDREHFRLLTDWFPERIDQTYDEWISGHDDQAKDSTRGVNRIVDGAGHVIADDKPDAVVSALREIVGAVRERFKK